jgi:hypothetical protein
MPMQTGGASIDDRRSYTGYVFNFANAAVSWESRKQRMVAMSSTETEYMALSESTKEAIHLRRFLCEVLDQPSTTIIFNDSQEAGQLSKNHVFHNRTKHEIYSLPLHTRSRGERRHQGRVPSHQFKCQPMF